MARIVWSSVARKDLSDIISFIRVDSTAYARSFALRTQGRVGRLGAFPDSGRLVPEDPSGTLRELIIGNFRVIYIHEEGVVTIVAVIHGARRLRI